jgi:translation initiation factor IF-2
MATKRKVSDIATQRKTSVDDVLAHLKKAGIEVVDGEVNVEDEAIDKALAAPAGGVRRRAGGPGGKRRRVIIDAGASRRGGGPQGGRGRRGGRGRGHERDEQPVVPVVPTGLVKVPSGSSVKDISQLLGVPTPEIIKALMGYGEMVTITQTLSDEAIEVLATDFTREVEITHAADEEAELEAEAVDDPKDLKPRASVITVMGHVDHGKTSLLDAIRDTAVAAGEAGGITQHIGAYQVKHKGQLVTFIDTPGHAAFTAMRARGAKVTDIAAIVVAADDGVMPQTVEAIDHAKAAGVPIVIVVNKIDKPEANVDRLKQQISEHGIIPEDWGGDTVFVEVSAKKRIGIDEFLDMLLLVAEVADLRANADAPASGFVIESRVDPGRGVVATILVSRGTLHVGDAVVAGEASGRVRAMRDFKGDPLKSGGPSTPVEIVGFDDLPVAGEFCRVVKDERLARSLAHRRANRLKTEALAKERALTLDDIFARIAAGKVLDLNIVVKADVQGSLEALRDALLMIQHPEVKVRVIHSGVGGINENDIMLASASAAIIIGFNVRPSPAATALAETEGVDVRTYKVIYKVTEDITAALVGMLKPTIEEVVLGQAEVRTTFKASKLGTIAGCMVLHGVITRNASVRVLRSDIIVHDGKMGSLKRFAEDAREVAEGFECGILVDSYNDLKEGDVLEAYETREVAREA